MQRLSSLRRFSRVLLVVLALAIGFAAGSVFVAYGASNDTYNACITPQGDIYRVRKNASWSCLTGHTKISWNQQGPQGLQGPPGASAQADVSTYSEDTTVPPQSSGGYTVDCEVGEIPIGGGWIPDSIPQGFSFNGSGPNLFGVVADGWTVSLANFHATNSATGTVYAICLAE